MRAIGSPNLPRLQEFLKKSELDAAIFLNSDPIFDTNIKYLSNFEQEPGGYSCLLLVMEKGRRLFISSLDFSRAEDQADVEEVIDVKNFKFSYSDALKNFLPKNPKIGIINSIFPLSLYEGLVKKTKAKFTDISEFMSSIKSIKSEQEIKFLKISENIATYAIKIIEKVVGDVSSGRKISEVELAKN